MINSLLNPVKCRFNGYSKPLQAAILKGFFSAPINTFSHLNKNPFQLRRENTAQEISRAE